MATVLSVFLRGNKVAIFEVPDAADKALGRLKFAAGIALLVEAIGEGPDYLRVEFSTAPALELVGAGYAP